MSFLTEPNIILLHGGEYQLRGEVVYRSKKLGREFLLPDKFIFSPSIPWFARIFVPVTSDIVAASCPHDFIYQTADQGTTQAEADLVGREELEERKVNIHIILRFYYALRLLGWIAWYKNRKKQREKQQ